MQVADRWVRPPRLQREPSGPVPSPQPEISVTSSVVSGSHRNPAAVQFKLPFGVCMAALVVLQPIMLALRRHGVITVAVLCLAMAEANQVRCEWSA